MQLDQQVAKEVLLVELAGTLAAGTLGGAGTFCSMLACIALCLHCGVTSSVFAGVHWCGVLRIVDWVAAGFGCRVAAGA